MTQSCWLKQEVQTSEEAFQLQKKWEKMRKHKFTVNLSAYLSAGITYSVFAANLKKIKIVENYLRISGFDCGSVTKP